MKRLSGFPAIVLATAAAGIIGYVIMWLVTQRAGAAGYAVFAVFWSAVYLVIGAASGIQQEITRATRPVSGPVQEHPRVARNFAIGGFATIVVAIVATSPIWIGPVFAGSWALVPPLAVAAGSYVFVAVLSGSLFGISSWGAVAALIAVDAVLRLVLLGVLVIFTTDPVALAWGVAAPFPLTVLLLWPAVRGRIVDEHHQLMAGSLTPCRAGRQLTGGCGRRGRRPSASPRTSARRRGRGATDRAFRRRSGRRWW